jgi:hypothetical protein
MGNGMIVPPGDLLAPLLAVPRGLPPASTGRQLEEEVVGGNRDAAHSLYILVIIIYSQ